VIRDHGGDLIGDHALKLDQTVARSFELSGPERLGVGDSQQLHGDAQPSL